MGIYLNPNSDNFKSIISAEIFVDKSMMISVINDHIDKGNKYICMSRPRRFGKTIAGNMLATYYSKGCDSADIFNNMKISADPGYEEKRNKYNVIKIDMNSEYQNVSDRSRLIDLLSEDILKEMKIQFPEAGIEDSDTLARGIQKVYSMSGESIDVDIGMYLNTMADFSTKDEVFTYLIHLGYLAYDRREKTCRIPNKEVRDEWARAISKVSDYEVTDGIIKAS